MSPSDYVAQLGMLVIDHRLRRIVDQLLAAQADVYAQEEIAFEPRWTSTFLLLEEEGPLAVTIIAARLRLTHPAVIKLTNTMIEADLVADTADADDERRRLLRLTPTARRLSPRLHRIWDALAAAQREIFRQAGCNPLDMIGRVEGELMRKPIAGRVADRLKRMKILGGHRRPR
jgi:DNA-binding MarR family transcriptional regulator